MMQKPKIAIGFDTIVDEDFGLIQLIFNNYLDPSVFDVELFKRSVPEIIRMLYTREEINPLLSFALKDSTQNMDELYKEFLSDQYSAILENSIGTNMQIFTKMLIDSKEFEVIIFCYNELQKDFISSIEEFKGINIVLYDDDFKKTTGQYYFKYLHQSYDLKNIIGAHFYYSTIGPNLNESRDDIKDTEESRLIKKTNYVSLYDLYDFKRLESSDNDNERMQYNGL